jgi:hypothetical protein
MNDVKKLVKEQYDKYHLETSKVDWEHKQTFLSNKCCEIIYNEWGMGTQGLWDSVDKYVEELIPSQYDEELASWEKYD